MVMVTSPVVECLPPDKCREHTSRANPFNQLINNKLIFIGRGGRKTKRHNRATKCAKQNNSAQPADKRRLCRLFNSLSRAVSYSAQSLCVIARFLAPNPLNSHKLFRYARAGTGCA
jgi:uncharacterized protein YegL